MDILWNILEMLAAVFEAFVAVRFVLKFQNYGFLIKSSKIKYVYASLGYAILTIVSSGFVPNGVVLGILHVVFLVVISLLLAESKIITKVFVSSVTVLVSLVVTTAMLGMFSAAFHKHWSEVFFEKSWIQFSCVISGQLIKVFIYDVILKTTQNNNFKLDKKAWALFLTVSGFSFFSIAIVQTAAVKMSTNSAILWATELCSIIVAAVCFYMTILLNKSQRESEKLKLFAQQEKFRFQYAQNVKKQYDEISQVRHDMKQIHSVVMSLLMEAKIDEAIEYMQKTAKKISEFDVLIDVGNDFVNAILNAKLSEAKRNGITVLCSADKNASGIDEVDLCNLLGNLLDNAIEACEKCCDRQRVIEIKIQMRGDKYLLVIENTAPENSLANNKQLVTTKYDTSRHGYGVKSIKSIAEKYNGMVDFSQIEDRFRSTVVLSIV